METFTLIFTKVVINVCIGLIICGFLPPSLPHSLSPSLPYFSSDACLVASANGFCTDGMELGPGGLDARPRGGIGPGGGTGPAPGGGLDHDQEEEWDQEVD